MDVVKKAKGHDVHVYGGITRAPRFVRPYLQVSTIDSLNMTTESFGTSQAPPGSLTLVSLGEALERLFMCVRARILCDSVATRRSNKPCFETGLFSALVTIERDDARLLKLDVRLSPGR